MPIELDCRELLDLAAITPSPSGTLRGRGAGRFHSRTSEAPYSQALASGDAWGSPSAAGIVIVRHFPSSSSSHWDGAEGLAQHDP